MFALFLFKFKKQRYAIEGMFSLFNSWLCYSTPGKSPELEEQNHGEQNPPERFEGHRSSVLTSAQHNFCQVTGINLAPDDGHAAGRNVETHVYPARIEKPSVLSHESVVMR